MSSERCYIARRVWSFWGWMRYFFFRGGEVGDEVQHVAAYVLEGFCCAQGWFLMRQRYFDVT